MDAWKVYIEKLKKRPYSALGVLLLLVLTLPLVLAMVLRVQDVRTTAALPDRLEAEGGVLTNGATEQNDSNASGGQYVSFLNPTPTDPPVTLPPQSGDFVGYGANTIGGTGGNITNVSSYSQFKNCLQNSGKRICKISGSGIFDGGGDRIDIDNPNITVDGSGSTVILKDVWLKVEVGEVIIKNVRIRTGDLNVKGADADPITINGNESTPIKNVIIDHVEAIWGPDVGGITILSNVEDVTVSNSIIGIGLFRSSHPEANEDANGHGMAMNITQLSSGFTWPKRITVYNNLFLHSQARNPAVKRAEFVDLINNIHYDTDEAPEGDPRGLNSVNNLFIHGPSTEANDLGQPEDMQWRYRSSDTPRPNSIYLQGNKAVNFTFGESNADPSVFRSSPYGTLSVTPDSTNGLEDKILQTVGPDIRDSKTNLWINDVKTRGGDWWSGDGFPGPNPEWP